MACMQRFTNILKKLAGPIQPAPTGSGVTIRYARSTDAEALAALAQLDSSHVPRGAVIVAEAEGELWAAVSVDDGHAIANPFRPSGELAFGLTERARELRRLGPKPPRRTARAWRPTASVGGPR
jgi:hypothetical protein